MALPLHAAKDAGAGKGRKRPGVLSCVSHAGRREVAENVADLANVHCPHIEVKRKSAMIALSSSAIRNGRCEVFSPRILWVMCS